MSNSVIWSTGSYLPENRVHNDELEFPETSRYLISQKTGVFARCRASPEQSTSDLGAAAARKCLERVGCAPEDVEGIIVSTSSPTGCSRPPQPGCSSSWAPSTPSPST